MSQPVIVHGPAVSDSAAVSRTQYITDLSIAARASRTLARDARARQDAEWALVWNEHAKRCATVAKFVKDLSAAQFAIFKFALAESHREPFDFVVRCRRFPRTMGIFK